MRPAICRLIALLGLAVTPLSFADTSQGTGFAERYFAAWVATQQPNAQPEHLEAYLALLTDDVGYQHLPYAADDSRAPDNKARMRKGMTYYLGSHSAFDAELTQVTEGVNVLTLAYRAAAKGVHPDTGKAHAYDHEVLVVLELDNGKVSVIRQYDRS